MAATAYAIVVLTLWGGGHAAQIAMLCIGYASAITAVLAFVASVVLIHHVTLRIRRGEPSAAAALVRDFISDRCRADRGLSLWQPPLTFVILMTAFTYFKQAVLPNAGFESGPAIAAADHALFGADPWRVTHTVLTSPWWSQIIDLAYHAWFAPMMLGVVICAFARPGSVLAWRYMLAYCLMFIVEGSILAYSFPAAGPVYFAQFHQGDGRFAGLTHLLATQDATLRASGAPGLTALLFQHHLLRIFQDGAVVLGGGISAMPSLHNAMAVLIACAAWHASTGWGRAMTAYSPAITMSGARQLG